MVEAFRVTIARGGLKKHWGSVWGETQSLMPSRPWPSWDDGGSWRGRVVTHRGAPWGMGSLIRRFLAKISTRGP